MKLLSVKRIGVKESSCYLMSASKGIQHAAGFIGCILLAGSATVFAQDSFLVCTAIGDDAERLACYDRAASAAGNTVQSAMTEAAAVEPPPVLAVDPASRTLVPQTAVAPMPRLTAPAIQSLDQPVPATGPERGQQGSASLALGEQDDFGLELKNQSDETDDADVREIIVSSAKHNRITGWRIETEDGQVWQQIGTNNYPIREGRTYIINRGVFNSFQLGTTENNRKIKVTRIQ